MNNLDKENSHIENLIHTYLSGTITQEDKDELFRWLIKAPDNVKYFNQISDIWLSSSVFQDIHNFDAEEAFNRVKIKINYANTQAFLPINKGIRLTWLKVAAILIPIIFISGLVSKFVFTSKVSSTENPFSFEVPYGSKATVQLPDGSKVELNAGSKLVCKEGFGKTHRMLNLVGEGYFKVAKNRNLPFVVHAGNLDVKALGTEFNVKAYPEDKNIVAILIHGSIQVNKTLINGKEEESVLLMPKERLVYDKKSDRIEINVPTEKEKQIVKNQPHTILDTSVLVSKTNIDPAIYTTWKEESWTIYGLTLSELAVELERKYDVKILFRSEELKQIKFTGTLPDISLEQVLSAIRLISPIEFQIKGKHVELLEDKKMMPTYLKYYKNSK